jgi:hypothetical protein
VRPACFPATCPYIYLSCSAIYTKKPATDVDADAQATWTENEAEAHHPLAQKLHDLTLTKHLHLDTVLSMWTSLATKFTIKNSHVVTTMHTAFDNLKCADNGNGHTHLNKHELVGIGITIPPKEYVTHIIGSLPGHYHHHLVTIEASA